MKRPIPLNPEQAWNYSLRLLSQRSYTEHRLREKLTLRQVNAQAIDHIMTKLKQLNVINDQSYAASLVRTESLYRHRSERAITQKLQYQGVDAETIKSQIKTHYSGEEEEQARLVAQKYYSRHATEPSATLRPKMAGYLARRGFPSRLVYKLVHEFTNGEPDQNSE